MPPRKIIPPTFEQKLSSFMNGYRSIPTNPTRFFDVGEVVIVGNLESPIITWVHPSNCVYEIEEKGNRSFRLWTDIFPKDGTLPTNFSKKDKLELRYSNRNVYGLISRYQSFGIEMSPIYQRGYVWELKDQIALIESIFEKVDIGKFVFVFLGYTTEAMYEVLDGKQRLRAILDFYEDRFPIYGNVFYSQLSRLDKYTFENCIIPVADISDVSTEDKIEIFLRINTFGKVMSPEHIESVRRKFLK